MTGLEAAFATERNLNRTLRDEINRLEDAIRAMMLLHAVTFGRHDYQEAIEAIGDRALAANLDNKPIEMAKG